jgi:dimethylargininase
LVARPGAESRRGQTAAVEQALAAFRPITRIEAPGTIDGGDVLVAGRRVFVGLSTRTNDAALAQMRRILAPHGYTVCAAEVGGCLHLKSAVTALDECTLLIDPSLVNPSVFTGFACVEVDPSDASAANALRLPDRVIVAAAFPRTAARIEARGYRVARVEVDELAKAEGAVTCCSLIVDGTGQAGEEGPAGRAGEGG